MTEPPPPVLQYADDAKERGETRSIAILSRCLLIMVIAYYLVSSFAYSLRGVAGTICSFASLGFALVIMAFVGMLGSKLHNILTGVVLALLVLVPIAGYFIPLILLANAGEELKKGRLKNSLQTEKSPAAPFWEVPLNKPRTGPVDENKERAKLRMIAIYQRCLIIVTIVCLIAEVAAISVNKRYGGAPFTLYLWLSLAMFLLVLILGSMLHNPLMGVVLALMTVIPCAGLFVPIMVILNANEPLKKAGIKIGWFGARLR